MAGKRVQAFVEPYLASGGIMMIDQRLDRSRQRRSAPRIEGIRSGAHLSVTRSPGCRGYPDMDRKYQLTMDFA